MDGVGATINYEAEQHSKDDARYGRPSAGSLTERRGIKAGDHVGREIVFLCEIIDKYAEPAAEQGQKRIGFGRMFDLYSHYSDKVSARNHVGGEIVDLCDMIDICGAEVDGYKMCSFGYLFGLYTRISDKLVGMLLRARKHGLVHFEGEMLYQRRDDNVIITLLKPIDEIKAAMKHSGDPKHCLRFEK